MEEYMEKIYNENSELGTRWKAYVDHYVKNPGYDLWGFIKTRADVYKTTVAKLFFEYLLNETNALKHSQ